MNDRASLSRQTAWMVWIVASVFYAYQYILRVMPNIMLDDIMQQFSIDAAIFGQFSGIYYIGYSLMHIPVGIMLDRFGPKKIMTGCILLTVVGLMPLLFTSFWVYPIIGRFFIGFGSSAAILGLFKIIRIAFSEARFSRMLSVSVTIGLLGAIYGGAPVSYLRDAFGYISVVQGFAIGGILLAIATYLVVPEIKKETQGNVIANIRQVLGNPRVIWCCLFAGCMVGPLEGFADVWGTIFLKQACGVQAADAASLPSMIFIGMCFGAPFLSFIAEKVKSTLGTIIGAGVVMCSSFIILLAYPIGSTAIACSFVGVGVASAYQILAIYKASTYVPEEVAGLTCAVANMIIMTFGYAFHATIGSVVQAMGGTSSSQALISGIWVIPIALIVGIFGFSMLFIKDSSKQKVKI